ncbi:MAG: tripartite tricarboxylate transporter substrate binding protein [Devosia sp.]
MTRILTCAALALGLAATPALAEYPEKDIQGVIQWGAGGSTDSVMRAVTPHAEEALGEDIIMQNMTGGVGSIAVKYVAAQPADGYTLLMGAENPQLYKVMGLGEIDYGDFIPVALLARGVPVVVARADAPYDTFTEMVAYIKENPGEVKFGSTGPGGLPSVVKAMLETQVELDVTEVPFNGDGPAITAVQGGAVDAMPIVIGPAIEGVRAGRLKVLALFDSEPNPLLPDVAPITEEYPGYSDLLPWGPFFGIFVAKETPDDAVEKLQKAYLTAVENPDFVKLMNDRGFTIMGLSGERARDFLNKWQSVTTWTLHEAGAAKKSPDEFGISKP